MEIALAFTPGGLVRPAFGGVSNVCGPDPKHCGNWSDRPVAVRSICAACHLHDLRTIMKEVICNQCNRSPGLIPFDWEF
jgi:hypothetical protein